MVTVIPSNHYHRLGGPPTVNSASYAGAAAAFERDDDGS